MLQYRDLSDDELTMLASLASGDVTVAPNADLPTRVVATAWLTKQTCNGVDTTALQAFIAEHHGRDANH